MTNQIIVSGPSKGFEGIKKIDENGIEYWEARELMYCQSGGRLYE